MDTFVSNSSESTAKLRVSFPLINGVELAALLAFGMVQPLGKMRLHDNASPVLSLMRRYIADVVEWVESFPFIVITRKKHLS